MFIPPTLTVLISNLWVNTPKYVSQMLAYWSIPFHLPVQAKVIFPNWFPCTDLALKPSRTQQTLKPFRVPVCRKKKVSLLHIPWFQRANSSTYKLGKWENSETKEKQSRNNCAATKQCPGPPQGIYITIGCLSLSSSTGMKVPTQVENV